MQFKNAFTTALSLVRHREIPHIVFLMLMMFGCASLRAADKVLILSTTVDQQDFPGYISAEEQAARQLGFDVDVKTPDEWSALTAAQFSTYRAIILGDNDCMVWEGFYAAVQTRTVWEPLINGNVIVIGTDPVYHYLSGQIDNTLIKNGIAFATARRDKLGFYCCLSCEYHDAQPDTIVPLLDQIGEFTVQGTADYNDCHIVASHPALGGITDTYLSGWNSSVHEVFNHWPADFDVLAIAKDFGATFTAADGTVGTPYILARGAGLRPTPGYTAVAVDKNDSVWVSGLGLHQKVLVSGPNAAAQAGTISTPDWGGFGDLIDRQGKIWSANGNHGLVRFEDSLTTPNLSYFNAVDAGDFNINLDPFLGNIWTAVNGEPTFQIKPDGTIFKYSYGASIADTVGIGADRKGNVWLANSDGANRIAHLRTDGTLLGWVSLPCLESPQFAGPRGIAVDGNGKIWTADFTSGKVFRIDPESGPIVYQGTGANGDFAQRLGAVDLSLDLGSDAFPDNYTDMAGLSASSLRNDAGTWITVHNGGSPDIEWKRIGWTEVVPANTSLSVQVRAANSIGVLENATYFTVPHTGASSSGAPLTGIVGQYVQIQATLSRLPGAVVDSTPILKDLRITSGSALPDLPSDAAGQLAQADFYSTYQNSAGISLDVMANDLLPTLVPQTAYLVQIVKTSSPKSGTVNISEDGKSLFYKPNSGFFGTDSFTYTIVDDQQTAAEAIVEVKVVQLNPTLPAPNPANDVVSINGNSDRVIIDVLANDCAEVGMSAIDCVSHRNELKVIGVSQPSHGIATIVNCNEIAYTPKPYFIGTDTFTYKVSNGSAQEKSATVTVTVTGDPPITVKCSDAAVSGSLAATDMKSLGRADYYCDTYYLNVTAGKAVTLSLTSSTFYPLLIVKSAGGAIISQNQGDLGTPAVVSFTPREPALYIVEVSSADGQVPLTGNYDLSWTCQEIWVKSSAIGLLSGDTLDFGIINYPGIVQLPITIGNDGASDITVSGFAATPGDFQVSLNSSDTPVSGPLADFIVTSGSSKTVFAYYTPSGSGEHTGTLRFTPAGQPEFQLSLTGHANPVGDAPTVTIQSPVNNSRFVKPVILHIAATASAATGITLQSVTIYGRRADQNAFSVIQAFSSLPLQSPFTADWDGGTDGLLGDYQIAVIAQDDSGRATIAYTGFHVGIASEPNDPPRAENDDRTVNMNSSANSIDVLANDTDSENDSLLITGYNQPVNGTVALSGNAFAYTPHAGFIGADAFYYVITDQHGGYSKAFVTIEVVDPNVPIITITAPIAGYSANLPIPAGLTINADASALGGATVTKVEFYSDGDLIGEDDTASGSSYSTTWTGLTAGDHSITGIVTDNAGRSRKSDPVQIHLNPKPNNVPPVAIIRSPVPPTSPLSDDVDFEPTLVIRGDHLDVSGDAHDGSPDTDNVTFQLRVYNSSGQVVARTMPVTGAGVTGGALGTIQFGAMPRGSYELELTVNDGSEERSDSISFSYESDLEIGQFKFSMEDMAIPIGGSKLTVNRTYDSLNSHKGDFGYSWTYSLADMQMTLDEVRADKFDVDGTKFNMRIGGSRDVTITMTDGKPATFRFNPGTPDPLSGAYKNVTWDAPAGMNATLEPLFNSEIDPDYIHGAYWAQSGDSTPFQNFDMPGFRLKMADGTQYYFQREDLGTFFPDLPDATDPTADFSVGGNDISVEVFGPPRLTRIVLPTKDEIIFSNSDVDADGNQQFTISHFIPDSTAPSGGYTTSAVLFRRNEKGVISEIYGPDALDSQGQPVGLPKLKYQYDGQTNLTKVLSLADQTAEKYESTTFLYGNPTFPHYITEILDGRNIPQGRTEYYSTPSDTLNYGKIKSITDAKGQVTSFVHALPDTSLNLRRPLGYSVPTMREEITYTPAGFDAASIPKTVCEADANGNVVYSKDTLGFEIWSKFATRESLTGNQHLDHSDPQSQIPLLVEQRYVVHEQGSDRTYLRNWEYEGTGSAEQKLAATKKISPHLLGATSLCADRYEYDALGQPTKIYDPNHSDDSVYQETVYDQSSDSPTYGRVIAQQFHSPGFEPDTSGFPNQAKVLFEEHYYDELDRNTLLKGMCWYSICPNGAVAVNEYYGSSEDGGRLGDVKSIIVYPAGTDPRNPASAHYLSKKTFTYDVEGHALTESKWRYERDVLNGNTTGETTLTTTCQYDAKGRLTKTIDASGASSEITYTADGNTETTTDRYGGRTSYRYDRQGELSGTEYPDGTVSYQTTFYKNDPGIGLLKYRIVEDRHFGSTVEIMGTVTVSDTVGRTIRSERVKRVVINVTHAQNSEVYDTAYDSSQPYVVLSRTITEYLPDGRTLRTASDLNLDNQITDTGDPDSSDLITMYEYSGDGLKTVTHLPNVRDGADVIRSQRNETHDASGQIITSQIVSYRNSNSDPDGHHPVTKYIYDALHRAKETWLYTDETFLDGHDPSQMTKLNSATYDWSGHVWLQLDSDNHGKAMIYDDSGRLSWVITDVSPNITYPTSLPTDIAGWVNWAKNGRGTSDSTATHYLYDEYGWQTTQIDGNNHATHYGYDALGRRTSRYLPNALSLSQGERWFYDCDLNTGLTVTSANKRPNVVRHIDFKNQQMFSIYDACDRLVAKKSDSATSLVDYEYNADGQRLRMVDNQNNPITSVRTTRYVYDEQNRLRIKNAPEGTVSYEYDSSGNLQTISCRKTYTYFDTHPNPPYEFTEVNATAATANPQGAYMAYKYDARRRLTKVNDDGINADAVYQYDSVGNRAAATYRNGVRTVYSYNDKNQLTAIKAVLGGNTLAYFEYDDTSWEAGRRLSNSGRFNRLSETINASTPIQRIVDYNYDALNHLSLETLGGPSLNTGTINYGAYEAAGNRMTRNVNLSPVVSALPNGTINYYYNANDELTEPLRAGNAAAKTDANGNTLRTDIGGSGNWDNDHDDLYDLDNRLVTAIRGGNTVSQVYDGDGNRVMKMSGAVSTYYVVDDRNPTGYAQTLEERLANNNANSSLNCVYTFGLNIISQTRGGTTSFYGFDGGGTVRYLTTASGTISDTYTYDAFGIEIARTGTTQNCYRYSGQQWDEDLKLYYLRARYYKPELGRFWSRDSYEGVESDPLTLHKYLYAAADPVNHNDPSGNLSGTVEEEQVTLGNAEQLEALCADVASKEYGLAASQIVYKLGAYVILTGLALEGAALPLDIYTELLATKGEEQRLQLKRLVKLRLEELQQENSSQLLFHYTNLRAAQGIVRDQYMYITDQFTDPATGKIYPEGAYATDISPLDNYTQLELAYLLYFNPSKARQKDLSCVVILNNKRPRGWQNLGSHQFCRADGKVYALEWLPNPMKDQ